MLHTFVLTLITFNIIYILGLKASFYLLIWIVATGAAFGQGATPGQAALVFIGVPVLLSKINNYFSGE